MTKRCCLATIVALCSTSPGLASGGGACTPSDGSGSPVELQLVELENRILTADYQADLEALAKLGQEASSLASDSEWGCHASYWSGFASWRSAMNGVNAGMGQEEIRLHLERAAAQFEESLGRCPKFADAYAASAGVLGWLARFHRDDPPTALKDSVLYLMRTRRALELEPDNPRVLWVDASIDLFLPAQLGGDPERAIRTYRQMIELTEGPPATDPSPDWGRPEAYMSLAFAHAHQEPPDLESALEEARAALRLRPDWSYVRDTLLPQIEAARSRAAANRPVH